LVKDQRGENDFFHSAKALPDEEADDEQKNVTGAKAFGQPPCGAGLAAASVTAPGGEVGGLCTVRCSNETTCPSGGNCMLEETSFSGTFLTGRQFCATACLKTSDCQSGAFCSSYQGWPGACLFSGAKKGIGVLHALVKDHSEEEESFDLNDEPDDPDEPDDEWWLEVSEDDEFWAAASSRAIFEQQDLERRGNATELALAQEGSGSEHIHIWHYALPCWYKCGGAGYCSSYCGPGNACCKYMTPSNPSECHGVRFWPILGFHTCVKSPVVNDEPSSPGGSPSPAPLIFAKNPLLLKPSDAPVLEFYVYRVQSKENYDPENQDVANLGGALWYLHNEIVWHPHLKRSGTYFSNSKTRIEKFRLRTRATQPLYDLGMNFGPVNTFDLTQCTGPYKCTNFEKFGFTVGCETWEGGANSFPHSQWVGKNKYPGAAWYSLPGPCSSMGLGKKTKTCEKSQPGGACFNSTGPPTGTGDCTYTYEKVGEVSIDELEGIRDATTFRIMGGEEYNRHTDKGHHMSFWDDKDSPAACQRRIDILQAVFQKKYPDLPDLPDPTCDFNRFKFYGRR